MIRELEQSELERILEASQIKDKPVRGVLDEYTEYSNGKWRKKPGYANIELVVQGSDGRRKALEIIAQPKKFEISKEGGWIHEEDIFGSTKIADIFYRLAYGSLLPTHNEEGIDTYRSFAHRVNELHADFLKRLKNIKRFHNLETFGSIVLATVIYSLPRMRGYKLDFMPLFAIGSLLLLSVGFSEYLLYNYFEKGTKGLQKNMQKILENNPLTARYYTQAKYG